MKLEIYPEFCCEECNEVIHNHMDCPECGATCIGTDAYGDIHEEEIGFALVCEKCKSTFQLEEKEGWLDDFEWILIRDKDGKLR